jgi:hypothetical protein
MDARAKLDRLDALIWDGGAISEVEPHRSDAPLWNFNNYSLATLALITMTKATGTLRLTTDTGRDSAERRASMTVGGKLVASPRNACRVGGVPLRNAEETFRTVSSTLLEFWTQRLTPAESAHWPVLNTEGGLAVVATRRKLSTGTHSRERSGI